MYTPGPWGIQSVAGKHGRSYRSIGTANYRICDIHVMNRQEIDETQMANARLIAAAPDLLEALEGLADVVNTIPGLRSTPEAIKARAAIAKAKGETNETHTRTVGKTLKADRRIRQNCI